MLPRLIMNNKKTSAIVLAGVAAFAYYKYSKMNPAEKEKMKKLVKEKGGDLLASMLPFGLKNVFTGSKPETATSAV